MTKTKQNRIMFKDVRLTWVFLQSPRPSDRDDDDDEDDRKGKYEAEILLHKKKDKLQIAKLKKQIDAAAKKAGFKGKWRNPLRDGDEYNEDAENPRDYYKDHYFVKAKSYYKPGVVTRTGEPAMPDDFDEMGFSGCYFHISVDIKDYDHKIDGIRNKGVKVQLGNVMMRKAGERLDGRITAENEFEEYIEDDDEDEDDYDPDADDDEDDFDDT